jgi:hypothetical protein
VVKVLGSLGGTLFLVRFSSFFVKNFCWGALVLSWGGLSDYSLGAVSLGSFH